jgi:DNA-binding response OmpR family regulator
MRRAVSAGRGVVDEVVLVVEDEESIAGVVRIALERGGYRAVLARTGEDGLAYLDRARVDLVILDIGLPGIDGLDVCRLIRRSSNLPIIMLTARDEETDRVVGLELGADDYVAKPFSPRELVARVKAVLRRSRPERSAGDEIAHGDIVLSRARHEAAVSNESVSLTPIEFELLAFLLDNAGVVVSREKLLESVWGLSFPGGTRTVDQHVAQLRTKLGRPDLIETVRGVGYKVARL